MSSLRNAVQRRNHKERAQPIGREKWGLLEKAKDYKLRAADHKDKRRRLKQLNEKATFRNPDEFYHGMLSQRQVAGGRAGRKGQGSTAEENGGMTHDVVKLLKTQDAGYLRTILQKTRKEREKRELGIQFVTREGRDSEDEGRQILVPLKKESAKKAKHLVFVDEEEEQKDFDPIEFFGTDQAGLQRSFNRPRRVSDIEGNDLEMLDSAPAVRPPTRKELEKQAERDKLEGRAERRLARNKESARKELTAIRRRETELQMACDQLDLQRAKMQNNIGGTTKAGKKFRIMERKR